MDTTDWARVTAFFNEVIANRVSVEVTVKSDLRGETLTVKVPNRMTEDFMKNLPLFEAQVTSN